MKYFRSDTTAYEPMRRDVISILTNIMLRCSVMLRCHFHAVLSLHASRQQLSLLFFLTRVHQCCSKTSVLIIPSLLFSQNFIG